MTRYVIVTLWTVGSLLVGQAGAFAERHDLRAHPPDRAGERFAIPPSDGGNATRPPSRNLYEPPAPLDPVFLPPLTKQMETGHAGVAGWAVPGTSQGSRALIDPDGSGWLGFGFAGVWGHPSAH